MTAKHAAQHSKKKAPAQPSIDASRGLMQSESACAPANPQGESHAGIYLQRAHMTAFGRFIDRTLGPFKPGLNVVYGPNEAGKTTARAFVGGVLFGWPEARGSRNAYKPRAASREGSLLFCDAATGEVGRVSRARNAEGLIGDDAWLAAVCGDIDRETFQTLFSLDADELRSLEAAPDISAKLLTAGSGTKESPAHVASALDARIAALMSRAASETESFPNLKRELEGVKERLLETRAQADELKAEDIELRSLLDDRERLQRELSTLDSKIEAMAACKGELSRIDSARHRLREEMASAQSELRTCEADARAELAAYAAIPHVSAEDEARLRASLELLSEQEDAAAQRLSSAREAYEQARGFWEARRDAATQAEKAPEARASRTAPIAAFCAAGLLAVAAFALALAVPDALPVAIFAMVASVCCVGVGALLIAKAKPTPHSSNVDVDSARATMVAHKSTYDSREGEVMVVADQVRTSLAQLGFSSHVVTARAALRELGVMHDAREAQLRADRARRQAQAGIDNAGEELARCEAYRCECLKSVGLAGDSSFDDVEAAAFELAQKRANLDERLEGMISRVGQLRQILSDGERASELDLLKTQRAQIITRQTDSAHELVRLLLAKRMVSGAIEAWGTESQPKVYERASHLMELMTAGAWVGVASSGSDVCAIDSFGAQFPPRLLSLGTCQQLYLALRIALLECAPEVGAAVPVLADDILVNFDDDRRAGAARALAELAQSRQVIVFTCHKEVVSTFTEQAQNVHVLDI